MRTFILMMLLAMPALACKCDPKADMSHAHLQPGNHCVGGEVMVGLDQYYIQCAPLKCECACMEDPPVKKILDIIEKRCVEESCG